MSAYKTKHMTRCKICGNYPTVYDDKGIGEVYCERCNNELHSENRMVFMFGNYVGRKKVQAIKLWNQYNRIYFPELNNEYDTCDRNCDECLVLECEYRSLFDEAKNMESEYRKVFFEQHYEKFGMNIVVSSDGEYDD